MSKLIGTDISRNLAQNHPDQINNNNKSNIHFINNKIYYQKTLEKILTQVPSNNGVDNYSDIPRIRPTSAEIILRQISNNKISFDYLSDNDLRLFLTGIVSTIHNSYQGSEWDGTIPSHPMGRIIFVTDPMGWDGMGFRSDPMGFPFFSLMKKCRFLPDEI